MVMAEVSTVDRRILKSKEAIKNAFVQLLSEKSFDEITMQDLSDRANVGRRTIYHHYLDKYDLLDQLIEEHIGELSKLCAVGSDLSFAEGNSLWFDYFEQHHSFFSAMLSSKGAPFFRSRFLDFVIEELESEVDAAAGRNAGLSKEVLLQFFGAAVVGIVESYFKKRIPGSSRSIAEQVGLLLDRNL